MYHLICARVIQASVVSTVNYITVMMIYIQHPKPAAEMEHALLPIRARAAMAIQEVSVNITTAVAHYLAPAQHAAVTAHA